MAFMTSASKAGPCAVPGTRPATGRAGQRIRAARVSAAQQQNDRAHENAGGGINSLGSAPLARRAMLVAGIAAAAGFPAAYALATDAAEGEAQVEPIAAVAEQAPAQVEKIFFGNGCFWGRQKDFVDVEMLQLGRQPSNISAVVGYAGGPYTARDGRVCYYYAPAETEYERLGHAEVVGVELRGTLDEQKEQLRAFSRTYFDQFRSSPYGMMRQDPQDEGPGYRNLIGVPGGMESPFMEVIAEENKRNMQMVKGQGNLFDRQGFASEDDVINRVYVMDSTDFQFHQAEIYHQFHNGLGKAFPTEYTRDLKREAISAGIIKETGCPENPFGVKLPF